MEQLLRAQVNDISEEEVLFEIAQVQSLPESPMEGEEVNKVEEVQCRIRVQTTASDEHDEGDLVNLSDVPDITQETKTKWVDGLMQFMHPGDQPQKHIRTIDLILGMDGSVRSTPEAEDTSDSSNTSAQEDTTASSPPKDSINTSSKQETTTSPSPKPSDQQVTYQYPYHYRIPPASISTLSQPDQTHRAEMFALATLFYEIGSGSPPYPNLPESEVQELYGKGEFPVEAEDLNDGFLVILAYWSKEFAGEIEVIAGKSSLSHKVSFDIIN